MSAEIHNHKAAEALEAIRAKSPLVHNITNLVVMNNTANALLASGASPVMAHARTEVEEMAAIAGALVINIGTLNQTWIEAMTSACRKANEVGVPVVLDPVGAGATKLRTETSMRLVSDNKITVVRANASEALAMTTKAAATKGVDSTHSVDEAADAARQIANELNTVVAITGAIDLVTDGETVLRVSGGHPLMGKVTGMGCTATALVGAFLAVEPGAVTATAAALAYLGLAGQKASQNCAGPGSFQVALLDALYNITPKELADSGAITIA